MLRSSFHGVVRVLQAAQLHLRLVGGCPDFGARVVVPKTHERAHPISFALLPKFDAGKPGSETGINLKAGIHGKQILVSSTRGPAAGGRRCASLSFFGSGKLEYYLATRRPALEVRGVDAFEPVANLHRCFLKQDPVFLRSLLRLAGRKIDRRFYFSHLLPGTQRGRAGRRAACSYVLLRNSFSGKRGSFTQQRPLGLSSVRRAQRPPRNVTVRCQDALAYLRALPRQAPRRHMCRSTLHLPRPQHELLWHEEAGA